MIVHSLTGGCKQTRYACYRDCILQFPLPFAAVALIFLAFAEMGQLCEESYAEKEKVKPITLRDVTIIDDGKLRKAITAASLGNAMEWFDFGVYGFVAYALGKVFPGADPSVQMVAALATFSVPFLIRPLGGLFFGMLGDKYGRQKILAITIVIMSISTFCIGLIPSYDTIGIWAPILLLICKMAQGFSVGGEYTGASIFVAEYSLTVNVALWAAGWTSVLLPGLCWVRAWWC